MVFQSLFSYRTLLIRKRAIFENALSCCWKVQVNESLLKPINREELSQ